jgi:hypothetical protein
MRPLNSHAQWRYAENLDVDIGTSPEVVDTFAASSTGTLPLAGSVTYLWSAFNRDDSTTSYNTGIVQITWNGARTVTLSEERARPEVTPEVTFTATVVAGPGASAVTVTLLATTTVNNYAVKVWRSPWTTQAVTV